MPDRIAFFLMDIAAWWCRDTWTQQGIAAGSYLWADGWKEHVCINPRWDGWRPGRYV